MQTFREWLRENELNESLPTVSLIKKIIKSTLKLLSPDAFNVELSSDDAGVGGSKYIKITFNGNPREKDIADIELIKNELDKKFKVKYYPETFVITIR